jgi:hypothetical protein
MIDDWAEQGQNLMMVLAAVAAVAAFGTRAWAVLSLDHLFHLFGS